MFLSCISFKMCSFHVFWYSRHLASLLPIRQVICHSRWCAGPCVPRLGWSSLWCPGPWGPVPRLSWRCRWCAGVRTWQDEEEVEEVQVAKKRFCQNHLKCQGPHLAGGEQLYIYIYIYICSYIYIMHTVQYTLHIASTCIFLTFPGLAEFFSP